MKKLLFVAILFYSVLTVNVNAKEMNLYFYPNGGKVTTSGFEVVDDYGFISLEYQDYYANYKGNSTIKKVNSIKGKTFVVEKSNTTLVEGKEWYFKNPYDGKIYYFSQSRKYKVSKIMQEIDLENIDFISLDLYANWADKPKKGGKVLTGLGKAKKTSAKVTKTTKKADILSINTIKMYKGQSFDLDKLVNEDVKKVSWERKDKGLIKQISLSGDIVYANNTGTAELIAKTSQGTEKLTVKVRKQTNDKDYSLSSCSSIKTTITGSSGIKVSNCIPDVSLKKPDGNNSHQLQGFAISNKYIYYSAPLSGTRLYEEHVNETTAANEKQYTTISVLRVPRNGKKMEQMHVEYAGHGQGLDVAGTNSDGEDILYMNLGAKFSDKTKIIGKKKRLARSTKYRGVGVTVFTGKANTSVKNHPRRVIRINGQTNKLNVHTNADFLVNGKFSETKYYNFLNKVARNNDYRVNPETSVDENHKLVAVRSLNKVLIYKESEFKKGSGSPIHTFSVEDGGTQGDDIYGNYFYTITGMRDVTIKKYNITTGQKEQQVKIKFTQYKKEHAMDSVEPEGITVYKGKVYIGLATKYCKKYDKVGDCDGMLKYNSILRVSGI